MHVCIHTHTWSYTYTIHPHPGRTKTTLNKSKKSKGKREKCQEYDTLQVLRSICWELMLEVTSAKLVLMWSVIVCSQFPSISWPGSNGCQQTSKNSWRTFLDTLKSASMHWCEFWLTSDHTCMHTHGSLKLSMYLDGKKMQLMVRHWCTRWLQHHAAFHASNKNKVNT